MKSVSIQSCQDSAREVQHAILAEIAEYDYDDSAVFAVRLALEEGLINAIKHGNCCDKSKKVDVEYDVTPQKIEIIITDEGKGFCPDKLPNPTNLENLERPSGRGVMLINAYMDHVEYNDRGNKVHMIKENNH